MIYKLIQFAKTDTPDSHLRKGEIIMEGKSCNGFLEKIIETGFENFIFQIQWIEEDVGMPYCFNIGRSNHEKEMIKRNEQIAAAVLPLLKFISNTDHSNVNLSELEPIKYTKG